MPAQRKTDQSRRRTAAGLIAVTAGTLLMMVWAIFPTAAFATVPWDGKGVTNGQFNNSDCNVDPSPHIFWVFTGDPGPGLTDVTLTVNGQTFDMNKAGGGSSAWQGTSSFFPLDNINASVDGVGGNLTISHGCTGQTTTTTTTTTPTTTTTTTTTPTSTTTTPTSTTTTPTSTTTTPTSTTTTPTSTTTTPTSTTTTPTSTTTTPGGGGGGGTTTTTTTIPTVAPTTVHNTSSATTTDEVLPTTVRPGGTAFTGVEDVVPIGTLALILMTSGSGLLWAGARRRRHDGSVDED
jgi:hypothetical protein